MSKDEILEKIRTLTGGRAAEEFMFNICTSGASNDIEQATRLARAMVAQLGMSDQFGMTALETVNNRYLSGDASLVCSNELATLIDKEVMAIIKNAHAEAGRFLRTTRSCCMRKRNTCFRRKRLPVRNSWKSSAGINS